MKTPRVDRITFELVVDGETRRVVFVQRDKIDDLMTADDETLGSWLRAIRDAKKPGPAHG